MKTRITGKRFENVFYRLDGMRFFGSLEALPNYQSASSFTMPRRYLRVAPNTRIEAGDMFRTKAGEVYLCAANGAIEYSNQVQQKTFRAFHMSHQFTHTRRGTVKDPVTGLMKDDVAQDLGVVWGTLEPMGDTEDTIRIPKPTYRVITSADIKVGDLLNHYEVKRIDEIVGIKFAEVE